MISEGLLKYLPKSLNTGWPWNTEVFPNTYDKKIVYPKISIITPSYNQGHYIEETIRSILLQNYPNLEYIIIDGGSTDETIEIIKKYDQWISYWVSESDNGQSHAINKGLSKCTGQIFNWLNSDDYYNPNALKIVGSNFFKSGCYSLIGYVENLSPQKLVYRTRVRSIEETIAFGNLVQPGTFFDLETIKILGGVNEEFHYLMDAELWLKFLFTYGIEKVEKVNDILVNFRLHTDSKTVSQQEHFNIEKLFLLTEISKKASLANASISKLKELTDTGLSRKDSLNVSNQITLDKKKLTSYLFYVASTKLFIGGSFKRAKKCLKYIDFSHLNNKKRCKVVEIYFGKISLYLRRFLKRS